ncbi:helix-hairpin-helix domain-containing protein [Cryobacterium adonitolivorans]|uniref:Helix-hairpin-helix domain-containing protein n=1 Tax=Cryobacterium adonitolivorans TaxID=1259189 RepID=A0A4R8VYL7_9MICO|nr:helix-hairpin-helix domain-containing protein [Cryobacterium adonitolivorans]TFB98222.1 helix-hairpin-helix domain-containing protein [Cryobacterium adonitolivorans]
MAFDPFNSLAPTSRVTSGPSGAPSGGAGRTRVRIGVGAAIVLLLAALGVTVAVTAIGQVSHSVQVPADSGAGPLSAEGAGSAAGEPVAGSASDSPADTADQAGTAAPDGASAAPGVFVHVLGAVVHPGLFEVHQGARVVDVVAAAGGLLPTADEAGLNLARLVADGEQLYVPALGEVGSGPPAGVQAGSGGTESTAGAAGTGAAAATVNLNTATMADLDTLPRIGPAMAQRILDYRAKEGRFASVEDLRNVTGIGEKTFAALKDLITV